MKEFEEIYKLYYPQVYRFVMSLCSNSDLAEEITQETFFRALKGIDGYRGDCKLSVWLFQIAKNLYFTQRKKEERFSSENETELSNTPDVLNVEEIIENKQLALKIHEVLHLIPEPYKEVFWMRAFGELSFAEIGKIHGKTESWARVTFHRAKLKIQEEIQ
ncbi:MULTISPECIES: RNA polymerase sigma factor [Pseudobutyrivibrio]|uniref:RNA polymerase sigma-70 factor, ECF subfamily n=2 Tax=Pseudobutyrivibrio xylanivorans TaxID=185007 RepID=A0A1M6FXE4_PSEXY|nr:MULTISPECIES: sigma-70 family RNA polymerase sigma factor [Pseudobutyrivibrio]MDC7280535.1 sigma-70 family RNA polymerase sigma factor [Butyrivibrio fibrisolvens]SCZ80402.1 RNA polymerase sigma-70 factor, ECF subfamily [Pseudobutyrivibrio xylanivorans]SHJ02356.1 RNA polymerase sigma-70 factor, ECF subfamily [Pseudobutyrivibrio xylanivorans DSM 14809]